MVVRFHSHPELFAKVRFAWNWRAGQPGECRCELASLASDVSTTRVLFHSRKQQQHSSVVASRSRSLEKMEPRERPAERDQPWSTTNDGVLERAERA